MAEHPEYNSVNVNISDVNADVSCMMALDSPTAAADVIIVPSDSLYKLVDQNIVFQIPDSVAENAESVLGSTNISFGKYHGKYYVLPYSVNSAEVLYYDKSVYTESEVKNLNTMLAKNLGKKANVLASIDSPWNSMTWFATAGAKVYTDGDKTINTLNKSEATEMIKWVMGQLNSGKIVNYSSVDDAACIMRDGYAGAAFGGPWAESYFRDAIGDNLGIAELPSLTVSGSVSNKHMTCFSSSLVLAINANCKNPEAALSLMQYLVSEDCQLLRYQMTGSIPIAPSLASNPALASDPLAHAVSAQNSYMERMNPYLGESGYWSLMGIFLNDLTHVTLTEEMKDYFRSQGVSEEGLEAMQCPVITQSEVQERLDELVEEMQRNVNQ